MKKQPKYSPRARVAEEREPLDAKLLAEARIKQSIKMLQQRGAGVQELLDNQLWSLLVEAGRGFIEAGRSLLEEAAVRQAIDHIERGVYAPIERAKG